MTIEKSSEDVGISSVAVVPAFAFLRVPFDFVIYGRLGRGRRYG